MNSVVDSNIDFFFFFFFSSQICTFDFICSFFSGLGSIIYYFFIGLKASERGRQRKAPASSKGASGPCSISVLSLSSSSECV